jgi:hypothetical protein
MDLYTSGSGNREFKAAYLIFPPGAQVEIRSLLRTAPGSDEVKKGIQDMLSGFAEVQNAKLKNIKFGMDLGLPTEFAEVTSPKIRIQVRGYLSSTGYYLFSSSADSARTLAFFNSIKLPPEIPNSSL